MQASTIDDVIQMLSRIIADARRNQSRLAFFASMYRRVTIEIKTRCDAGFFNNNQLMRHLDVVFANYYFRAYHQLMCEQEPCASWAVAFDACDEPHPIILQHLLLGMSAHISFDLGMATVEATDGILTPEVREDFDAINDILAGMVNDIQGRVNRVSRLCHLLDRLSDFDEALTSFSIERARDAAWDFAVELAHTPQSERDRIIEQRDNRVADFGKRLLAPAGVLYWCVRLIQYFEKKEVGKIVDVLEQ